jgi:hypothetical protein
MTTTPETLHIAPEQDDLDTLAVGVQVVAETLTELTGCQSVSVILHAHRLPAERWHALPARLVVMPRGERPTLVAKRLAVKGAEVTTWCSDDRSCPDLANAQDAWDAAHEGAV